MHHHVDPYALEARLADLNREALRTQLESAALALRTPRQRFWLRWRWASSRRAARIPAAQPLPEAPTPIVDSPAL